MLLLRNAFAITGMAAAVAVAAVALVCADPRCAIGGELGDWLEKEAWRELKADDADPGRDQQLRIHGVVDRSLGFDVERMLDPCASQPSTRRRFYCWSSHGKSLRMFVPELAWNVAYVFRPRTLYSYRAVDLRFPPQVRVRLPLDASMKLGYEDNTAGLRLRFEF